jgi:hypothetical protein
VGESKRKKVALRSIGALSLDEHVDDLRARAASEFRRQGEIRHRLEAVTEGGEVFEVDTHWHDHRERAAFRRTLPGVFQRRGVKRYLMAQESWVSSGKPGVRPSQDSDRTENALIIAVERGGERRTCRAEIKRTGKDAALGDWASLDGVEGWMYDLFDDAGADETGEARAVPVLDDAGVETLLDADPDRRDQIVACMELHDKIREELDRLYRPGEDWAVFGALCAIIIELPREIRAGLKLNAQTLRDRPDVFPITPSVRPLDGKAIVACVDKHERRYRYPIAEILEGQPDAVVFNAVVNTAMHCGVALMGGPGCADYLELVLGRR